MVKARNLIIISGKILSIRRNRDSMQIILENNGETKKTTPIFSVYDTSLLEGYDENMKVRITAHVENRKSKNYDGTPLYIKEFVVDKIEKQKRMLAPYLLNEDISEYEGGFPRDVNICLIIGEIYHIYHPKKNFAVVTIRIPNGSKSNQADVVCFMRQAEQVASYREGDAIAAAGYVTSKIEDAMDSYVQKQSIVCRDLEIISSVY